MYQKFDNNKKAVSFAPQYYKKAIGGVPERSNGTDCKSVTSVSQVRILPSPQKIE